MWWPCMEVTMGNGTLMGSTLVQYIAGVQCVLVNINTQQYIRPIGNGTFCKIEASGVCECPKLHGAA